MDIIELSEKDITGKFNLQEYIISICRKTYHAAEFEPEVLKEVNLITHYLLATFIHCSKKIASNKNMSIIKCDDIYTTMKILMSYECCEGAYIYIDETISNNVYFKPHIPKEKIKTIIKQYTKKRLTKKLIITITALLEYMISEIFCYDHKSEEKVTLQNIYKNIINTDYLKNLLCIYLVEKHII